MNRLSQCVGVVLLGLPLTAWSLDESVAFTATPERCIALHKGQTCYQEVQFRWQTPDSGQYCLVLNRNRRQLTCWNGNAMQQYQYNFEGEKTTTFSLIRDDEARPLAEVKVVVTWVYKAPKQSRSGWRLF
ncbi:MULTISPECIES: DUF3019 domain-containing protein [Ferrimonas]|uniref:DUF3019 domain-containing protein n=1 Tax=Ferrimonas TaxID=44011 RepID=UPI0003F64A34|nr:MULTISPECIES: DUF3019 domain-containing protein [Ferrimonas]USD37546.1 DUF3019 domain-containing protein [Ferrimonas sp. SCSIO 43195]